MLLIDCSIVSAYTPTVAIDIADDIAIYNSDIVQRLNEDLIANLSVDKKFIITDKEEADFIIEGKILGMGTGQLVNNPLGTAFTLSGSAASLFMSPFTGPVIGGIGLLQTRKHVFAIGVGIHVIRNSDKMIVKKKAFLGRTNLNKVLLSPEVLNSTVDQTAEIISKYFIRDIDRDSPKIFIEPAKKIKFNVYD